jgi:hypothetical protein
MYDYLWASAESYNSLFVHKTGKKNPKFQNKDQNLLLKFQNFKNSYVFGKYRLTFTLIFKDLILALTEKHKITILKPKVT